MSGKRRNSFFFSEPKDIYTNFPKPAGPGPDASQLVQRWNILSNGFITRDQLPESAEQVRLHGRGQLVGADAPGSPAFYASWEINLEMTSCSAT